MSVAAALSELTAKPPRKLLAELFVKAAPRVRQGGQGAVVTLLLANGHQLHGELVALEEGTATVFHAPTQTLCYVVVEQVVAVTITTEQLTDARLALSEQALASRWKEVAQPLCAVAPAMVARTQKLDEQSRGAVGFHLDAIGNAIAYMASLPECGTALTDVAAVELSIDALGLPGGAVLNKKVLTIMAPPDEGATWTPAEIISAIAGALRVPLAFGNQ